MRLQVSRLSKEFPAPSGGLPVLCGIDLDLDDSGALAIMGPSGSGKSTLLHILGGLDRPTAGQVILDGTNPFSLNERDLARFRNRHIGFVFQDHYLLPQCTVLENVILPSLLGEGRQADTEKWARELLQRVGLKDRLHHLSTELSGGERQRAAVARALVMKPGLILADEPTGNLDRRNADAIARLLLQLQKEEKTLLVAVTHSQEMADMFPRVETMEDGRLVTKKS
ncbi:MAG: ABC transporter ATP-binding protein [Gemmataceae bacterium]|nr:ABC transporter ATP-binding protein [Gemmataceae bacterium]